MRTSVSMFAVLLLVGTAGTACAQGKAGRLTHLPAGKLLSLCQSPHTGATCEAYLSGMSDGLTLVEGDAGPDVARKVCIPDVSGKQLRGAVVGWLSKHPERLSSDVGPVVYDALAAAFPCPAGAGKP